MSNTYKSAGVDIEAGELAVQKMKEYVHETYNENCLTELGSFGGLFKCAFSDYEEPVLVSSIDGVGTKVKIASMMNKYDTVGQDIVNHCIDDILVQGASPLFFMDYFATAKLDPIVASEIVKGMSIACKENGCAILGGETAEMPGVYSKGEFDIAGSIVGVVDRKKIIDGTKITPNLSIIGFASSGAHTNGYSLIRKLFFEDNNYSVNDKIEGFDKTLGETLLAPHKCYYKTVKELLKTYEIYGMAHITGGGFYSNIKRILPDNITVEIDAKAWNVPPLFKKIQELGKIENTEMYKAFNMGIGLCLFVDKDKANDIINKANSLNEKAFLIGKTKDAAKSVRVIF
ncbi:MAG: phosphoribosylformylglycinamidine cyclo-ligase [Abditibacteriota bacterium]|nr:phosphoribosylformylglycinamidine cyclo-ligase [Abditibacteriota bacterium]